MNTCAEKLAAFMNEKNLSFNSGTDRDGDSVIEIVLKGKEIRMFFAGDDGRYLTLFMICERVPADKVTNAILACNQLNNEYKWVTFTVDRDNDLMAKNNAILSVSDADEVAFELLLRLAKICEDVRPQLMKAIYV